MSNGPDNSNLAQTSNPLSKNLGYSMRMLHMIGSCAAKSILRSAKTSTFQPARTFSAVIVSLMTKNRSDTQPEDANNTAKGTASFARCLFMAEDTTPRATRTASNSLL